MNINIQAGSYTLKAVAASTWNWFDFLKKAFRKKSWMAEGNKREFGVNY